MSQEARRTVVLPGPVSLRWTLGRTVSVLADPTLRLRGAQAWCAFRTEDGPATVRYAQVGECAVEVTAWGDGRECAVALAPAHLGADDRPEELAAADRRVAALQARFRGLRFGRSGRVLAALVPTILGQKVSGKEATQAWHDLVHRHGEPAPRGAGADDAPKLWLAPSPQRLRELAYYDLHPLGVERRRAEVIIAVARQAERLERAAAAGREALATHLAAIRGVGPWTEALVASAVFGDADAVPVGDYHLPHLVAHAMTGAARGDDARMLELLEPFRPHRGRVLALLSLGAPPPPRFGPRLPLRDFRRI